MKKYCMVIEVKKEFVKDYSELHRNPRSEMLNVMRTSGAKELLIWNYKNFSIVYFECEDINKYYENIAKFEITKEWNQIVEKWFKDSPKLDGSEKIKTCEKFFDLNQQQMESFINFRDKKGENNELIKGYTRSYN